MSRVPQSKSNKGSQKWIQGLVNHAPEVLNTQIKNNLTDLSEERIVWLSPKVKDEYAEYRDQAFIDLLGINLAKVSLKEFWPPRGPQWDALGKTNQGTIFLVEAKAHIPELNSPGTQAQGKSLSRIRTRLDKTKEYLNGKSAVDWSNTFYQYTNRLAHLYLLRVMNNLPAYLIFVYFVNDLEMDGPKSVDEWRGALKLLHTHLGIERNKLSKSILELFIDVSFVKQMGI